MSERSLFLLLALLIIAASFLPTIFGPRKSSPMPAAVAEKKVAPTPPEAEMRMTERGPLINIRADRTQLKPGCQIVNVYDGKDTFTERIDCPDITSTPKSAP